MKNITREPYQKSIKYLTIALCAVAFAVFVVLPLMPQVDSMKESLTVRVQNGFAFEGGTDVGNGDAGNGVGGSEGGGACCGNGGFDSGTDVGNGDPGDDSGTSDPNPTPEPNGPSDPGIPPVLPDLCPNIGGVQESIPAGMIVDGNGNCVTPPPTINWTPYCTGAGNTNPTNDWQWWEESDTTPKQFRLLRPGDGSCVPPVIPDLCPNIAGFQAAIPVGMVKDAAGNCVPPVPPDLCPNIPGDQAAIPVGMVKDAAGNCITPPTPISGTISATIGSCVNATERTVAVNWSTQNAQHTVAQASGGQYGAGQNISAPAVTPSGNITLNLTAGGYAFSVSGHDGTNWVTLQNTSLMVDTSSCGGTTPVDVCPNIEGDQATIPSDMVKDSAGNCVKSPGGGGGGGGGSSSPRCTLFEASDRTIRAGESIKLHWKTVRGTKIEIDHDVYSSTNKDKVKENTVTVRPTKDTKYKLTVSRGSRKDTCVVDVKVGGITAISTRDQQPLTSIAFNNLPYTGFEAGPTLTALFYVLLTLWSLALAYILVIKRGTVFGFALPARAVSGSGALMPSVAAHTDHASGTEHAHATLPTVATIDRAAPLNLPTAPAYMHEVVEESTHKTPEPDLIAQLEAYAHKHNVLLSSDALRMVADHAETDEEGVTLLTDIVNRAKGTYAREDGWVVLNRERVMSLFPAVATVVEASTSEAEAMHEDRGAHTLAEAILTGNTTAAYSFLGDDALEVIADTAETLDGIVRARAGNTTAPDMLMRAANGVSDEKLKAAILALVTAIDGTYPDQNAGVRLAVIKALKATQTN